LPKVVVAPSRFTNNTRAGWVHAPASHSSSGAQSHAGAAVEASEDGSPEEDEVTGVVVEPDVYVSP
jgi:hypothetical protein